MPRTYRIRLALVVIAALALALPIATLAHERREVADGQYQFVVGFIEEPAFVGEKNGLSLRITKPGGPEATPTAEGEEARIPIEGLETTLTAEVIYGDQSMDLPLQPAFRDPGLYVSHFFPMAEGDYSFHIAGEIEGVAVDETFTSSPDGFDSVQAREPLEFPKDED
ncbi:MAG: hypothetical protein ACRDJH_17370 [Thermomicrobiales bacterium]